MSSRAPILLLTLLLAACAGAVAPPDNGEALVDAATLLSDSPLYRPGYEDVGAVDMLAVSPEMAAFLETHVDSGGNENDRLAQLVMAIVNDDRFRIAYDDSTRTAASAFERRRGNCLSFTSLFIALARGLGLDASYQEVEIPPDWSMSGQAFLLSRHVNAVVDIRNALSRVVDFNTYEFNAYNESRAISDTRARAHYFNNIGAEAMLAGETADAYANLSQGLIEDPGFAPAWVNLGILHRREGYLQHAETAFLEALEQEKNDLLAMSNLASLYEDMGRRDEAERLFGRVRSHRMKNPYYRYEMANQAFAEGDYDAAISHLRFAIRKREDEDSFYHLLSLSYLMNGDREQAREWMQKAEETAQESRDQQRYHHKLELLSGASYR